MFGLKHGNGTYIRVVRNAFGTQFVAGGDLKNPTDLLLLPDLWSATRFVETNLRNYPIEIVELEMRELRTIPPIRDVTVSITHAT